MARCRGRGFGNVAPGLSSCQEVTNPRGCRWLLLGNSPLRRSIHSVLFFPPNTLAAARLALGEGQLIVLPNSQSSLPLPPHESIIPQT